MRVESVTVAPDAVAAVLRFEPGESLRSSEIPGLVDALVRALPGLRGHRCDNGSDLTFLEEARDTELAHLVEHAALEVMAMAGSPAWLHGETRWDFAADGRGVFRVNVEYDDEMVAIGALKVACDVVGGLARGYEAPDVVAEAVRLKRLRKK